MGESTIDLAYKELAAGIVIQAISDWRHLCGREARGNATGGVNINYTFNEMRMFFQSKWCADLCGKVDPAMILAELEQERKNGLKSIITRRYI